MLLIVALKSSRNLGSLISAGINPCANLQVVRRQTNVVRCYAEGDRGLAELIKTRGELLVNER